MPIARGICAQNTAPTDRASVNAMKYTMKAAKPSDNRRAFAPLKRSPYEGAHDHDLQSGAQAHRDSNVAFRAAERRREDDGKRDRTQEHGGVKQGEGRESQHDR